MFQRLFLDHPRRAGEGYFQHQWVALSYALPLLGAAGAAFLHAVIPGLCQTTAGDAIRRMNARLEGR
jgi:hypothetical protein